MIFEEQINIAKGLDNLLLTTQSYTESLPQKLAAMERVYLKNNPGVYGDAEIQQMKYYREAYCYKFYLSTMHLEELWALTHTKGTTFSLEEVLSNIFDNHRTSKEHLLLWSFVIEAFIVQGNAFLDFYMLHLCSIFQVEKVHYLSGKKLMNALQKIQRAPFAARADKVRRYLTENVFGDNEPRVFLTSNWGQLLKTLRNSILHRDQLKPSFEEGEDLLHKLNTKWPSSLQEITCSRFCQDVQNVMFELVQEIAATIYGLEWKPGVYRPNLW
jgi:hypothetical protein